MKLHTKLLIIALMIFVAFLCVIYISNLKSFTYFNSPNKIILYENGHKKKTYTRFSFKYKKILKALDVRYHENVNVSMNTDASKEELDDIKNNGKVLILEYNNINTSTLKSSITDLKISKIKYCSIYFPLNGYHATQVIYLFDRNITVDNDAFKSLEIRGLYLPEGINKILK